MNEQPPESFPPSPLDSLDLSTRVARLEGKLGWRDRDYVLNPSIAYWAIGVGVAAVGTALMGLGLPNHYYQVVLAAATVALCYHRECLIGPKGALFWLLALLNTAMLSILFKLLIGSGKRYPFDWVLYPALQMKPAKESNESWVKMVPDWQLTWEASSLSAWSIDLTVIQTFLMLITLIGALFDFQPFISLTALLLILFSLPALVAFNWTWVFPAIMLAALAFYLQSVAFQEDQQ